MSIKTACMARVYGDQTICGACQLTWDTNDHEPPECGGASKRQANMVVKFDLAQGPLVPKVKPKLPDVLPDDLALEMLRAFNSNGGHILGMKVAYRVFLDRIEP